MESSGEQYWKKLARNLEEQLDNAKGFEQKYENLRLNGVVTSTSTATAGSITASVVVGKLTVAHLRALRYHIYNNAWSDVKFIPNIHVFKTNPEILERARKAIGIEMNGGEETYDASLMARYKYEINQRRGNVKTAVRKKYRGTCSEKCGTILVDID